LNSYPADVNGRPIQPGQRIVYAVRKGSCSVVLRPGTVINIEKPEASFWSWRITVDAEIQEWPNGVHRTRVTLAYPERIAVL